MRSPVASRLKKALSSLCAALLCCSLIPTTALASQDSLSLIPEGDGGAVSIPSGAEGGGPGVLALRSEAAPSVDGDGAVTSSENVSDSTIINQTMPLETVAQQESTRSYFLAQTLESTKTVPIVSANLPLDKGTNQGPQAGADGGTTVSSEDEVTDGDPSVSAEDEDGSEPEGGDDSDESDLSDASDSDAATSGVSSESTVVGSFTYLGMTFTVEPGGESVALVAVDYSKLPEEFVQKQILVVPDAATPDGMDCYSVTRIAANAFSSLTKDNANPDYIGCIELFSDEELLAEAGIDSTEVAEFLSSESDMVDIDGDGEVDATANPLKSCTGILGLGVPASITSIENNSFAGAETLQYLVVSKDNPEYASFDGALYDIERTTLLTVPEGRVGALSIHPSVIELDLEALSQCSSITVLVANAENASLQERRGISEGNKLIESDMLIYFVPFESYEYTSMFTFEEMLDHLIVLDVLYDDAFSRGIVQSSRASHAASSFVPEKTVAFENVRIYYKDTVHNTDSIYVDWNSTRLSLHAESGVNYAIGFNSQDNPVSDKATVVDKFKFYKLSDAANVDSGNLVLTAPFNNGGRPGSSVCHINGSRDFSANSSGGLRWVYVQCSGLFQNKTIRFYDTTFTDLESLPADAMTNIWLNSYSRDKWLSVEYLPEGGRWASQDPNMLNDEDSKYYEWNGSDAGRPRMEWDGTNAIRVTVEGAPETSPDGMPVFLGWKCLKMDGTYMDRVYQPGDIIENVTEPLRFEAQWASGYTLKWSKNAEGVNESSMPWDVSLGATGGSGFGISSRTLWTEYLSTSASLRVPTHDGWIFAGWYTDEKCGIPATKETLDKYVVPPSYVGPRDDVIKASSDGSVTLYAGWANPYDNLRVYSSEAVYVNWGGATSTTTSFNPLDGAPYRIIGDSVSMTDHALREMRFYRPSSSVGGSLLVTAPRSWSSPAFGTSVCYLDDSFIPVEWSTSDGGISALHVQSSAAKCNKTVRYYSDTSEYIPLDLGGVTKIWLNGYNKEMWLSEEYLPNGGTWATVDTNATSADDSKYYEYEGKTYDGTTSTTITVKAAPENVPTDKPVFTGWKCLNDGKVYLPGDVIGNVKEPLRFEAQWASGFTLRFDDSVDDGSVAGMPQSASIAATAVGSLAINVRGIASVYPSTISLPTTPTRDGWSFVGWYMDADCKRFVNDAVLSRMVVSSNYSGSDVASCTRAAADGSVTLYAGWAIPYENLRVYSARTAYVAYNNRILHMGAQEGVAYRVLGDGGLDADDKTVKGIKFNAGGDGGDLQVTVQRTIGRPGGSLCYTAWGYDSGSVENGGVTSVALQDSTALRSKTVRRYDATTAWLSPSAEGLTKLWINDYRYSMWLSEEYLPGEGASWASVDANATSADDSKYYEHEGSTYDGTTSVTVTVREAPENAPKDKPVFLGWRCRLMDGSCMEGLLQPGDEIEDVSEPLVFEAVWTDIYNVAVPLMVGVALDPATGEARASEGASLSTTNPSQVKVVSLEYDLVEETDDLDGKGEAAVPGGGTHRVFSDEEGASHLDEVSLTVLAGEAAGGGEADAVPLEVPLSAPSRLDDADALAAAGFVPFGAAAGDLAIEYGLRFSLEGDALADMLGRLNFPEKDGLDGTSSESFPIAKLFYTIAMA